MYELDFRPSAFEALTDAEDWEAFDAEIAEEDSEEEFRRLGRLPGRAPGPRTRTVRRRIPPRRPRPLQGLTRPLRRIPKRPRRPAGGIGGQVDSSAEPSRVEGAEQGSEYVRWVQSSLNQVLGLRLPITGVMNAAVRSALRTFQAQQKLFVDGIAGPETRKALVQAKAKGARAGDEPSGSPPAGEPSKQGAPEEPAPSAPSEEPSSPDAAAEPAQQEEYEWAGEGFHPAAESETDLSGLPESVGKALRAGLETVAIKLAVAAGVRDETMLTNLVFHARHPARRGRQLRKSEPRFRELSREWLDIRSRVVRPALRLTPVVRPPSGPPPTAPTDVPDIVRVRGISVARRIATNVEALLAAAEADGIALGGWGYRSRDRQIELRRQHCGPTHYDIYEKPSSQCTPPTATPGKSMHEKGLAIDFTYGGETIKSRSTPGFQWLSQNAGRFGLFNLPSEPWHWSENGR